MGAFLLGHVVHDSYFADAHNATKVVKNVRFDALMGVTDSGCAGRSSKKPCWVHHSTHTPV